MEEPSNEQNEVEPNKYPDLILRIKAAFIDGFLVFLFAYGLSDILLSFESVPNSVRVAAIVFLFTLYDPISISVFGRTIGQNAMGIRVKREDDEDKNISFPSALLRYILKAVLGWISFLTIGKSLKKKAIHDSAVHSVVVFAN